MLCPSKHVHGDRMSDSSLNTFARFYNLDVSSVLGAEQYWPPKGIFKMFAHAPLFWLYCPDWLTT